MRYSYEMTYTARCQASDCGRKFDATRPDAIYHDNACRQRAYRDRHRVETQATIGRGLDEMNRNAAARGSHLTVVIDGFAGIDSSDPDDLTIAPLDAGQTDRIWSILRGSS